MTDHTDLLRRAATHARETDSRPTAPRGTPTTSRTPTSTRRTTAGSVGSAPASATGSRTATPPTGDR